MLKQVLYFLTFIIFLTSCTDKTNRADSKKKASTSDFKPDTSITNSFRYKSEQDYLKRKKNICDRLALYDLEKGKDSLELRMWYIPSMWDPSILYVLKTKNSRWTLFHYQIYMQTVTSENHYYADPVIEYFNNPLVDSVVMESVSPQKTDWKTYINSLQLDSLWNLQTESSISGIPFVVLDGHSYILEFNKKGKYKYLFYTTPEDFQTKNNNHKSFIEFKKRLIDPIIYRGMHNP